MIDILLLLEPLLEFEIDLLDSPSPTDSGLTFREELSVLYDLVNVFLEIVLDYSPFWLMKEPCPCISYLTISYLFSYDYSTWSFLSSLFENIGDCISD